MQKRRKIKLIGLTGGVATGKSTVARMFARLGFPTVDTDKIAHHLMRKGTLQFDKIVKAFGSRILQKNGDIDRKKIALLVFKKSDASTKLRRILEAILHPAIWRDCKRLAGVLERTGKTHLIIEVPLLFETGWNKKMDVNIVASCGKRAEIKRCKGILEKRIAFQLPLFVKEGLSDLIIDTSGSKSETMMQVKILSQMIDKAFPN